MSNTLQLIGIFVQPGHNEAIGVLKGGLLVIILTFSHYASCHDYQIFWRISVRIYPIDLEIKDSSASYLNLHREIDSEGWIRRKLYNNDFNRSIVNLFKCGSTFQ